MVKLRLSVALLLLIVHLSFKKAWKLHRETIFLSFFFLYNPSPDVQSGSSTTPRSPSPVSQRGGERKDPRAVSRYIPFDVRRLRRNGCTSTGLAFASWRFKR